MRRFKLVILLFIVFMSQEIYTQDIGFTITEIDLKTEAELFSLSSNADTAFIVAKFLAETQNPTFSKFINESINKAQENNNELALIRLKSLKAQKELELYGIENKQYSILKKTETFNGSVAKVKSDFEKQSELVINDIVEKKKEIKPKEKETSKNKPTFDIEEVIKVNPNNKLKIYAQATENYFEKDDYEKALKYGQLWLNQAQQENDTINIIDAKNIMGELSRLFGLSAKSLTFHQEALNLSKEKNDYARVAISYSNLGALHASIDNYKEAMQNLDKALAIQKVNNIPKGRNIIYQRRAKLFLKQKKAEKAILEIQACSEHCRKMGNMNNVIMNENIIGDIHKDNQELSNSLERYEKSFTLSDEYQKQSLLAMNYADLGILSNEKKEYKIAIENCKKGYKIAKNIKHDEFLSNNCSCLYTAYKAIGNDKLALQQYEEHKGLQDKIYDTEQLKKVSRLQATFQYENEIMEKDYEITLLEEKEKEQRFIVAILGLLAFLLTGIASLIYRNLYLKNKYNNKLEEKNYILEEQKVIIQEEKHKTEELLLNILPAQTAQELKEKGIAEAKEYQGVSILFSDFVGFTQISEKLSAKELVEELNYCFKYFDELMDKYQIEKIKTIGDAYMCASGLPNPATASIVNTLLVATEMQNFIEKRKRNRISNNKPIFEMRIGIHTGSVVAGIVGTKKFQYDIWGDTVNIAARMESCSTAGKINISAETYELVKYEKEFEFECRGELKVKGKGDMKMYFVKKIDSILS